MRCRAGPGQLVRLTPDRERGEGSAPTDSEEAVLAERERRMTRPYGGVFVARTEVLDRLGVERALRRMAHEILDRNGGLANLALIGLQTGGVPLASGLATILDEIEARDGEGTPSGGVPVGALDVAFYRDDVGIRPLLPEAPTSVDFDIDGLTVVLVDDVLFTGRTIRAALDALFDLGRPQAVQLAVMVDRGHRELPIRPDFVGKSLPTRRDELVNVTLEGVELGELVKS